MLKTRVYMLPDPPLQLLLKTGGTSTYGIAGSSVPEFLLQFPSLPCLEDCVINNCQNLLC